ncbi:hypothetical protein QUB61_19170 [Microcoleus sp. C2D2]
MRLWLDGVTTPGQTHQNLAQHRRFSVDCDEVVNRAMPSAGFAYVMAI